MATRKHERLLRKRLADLAGETDPKQRLVLAHDIQLSSAALEQSVVAEAREAGVTWTQIGALFGMTKQAAQQRFRPRAAAD